MHSLETIIKLQKSELDKKRIDITELENQKDEVLAYYDKLHAELEKEKAYAAENPEFAMTFESFRQITTDRQNNIKYTVKSIDKEIQRLNAEIADLFGEMKKYEILLQKHILEEQRNEKKKEEIVLNEIAINRHIRD